MSANITKFRQINSISDLKQILFPEQQTDRELNRDDDYDNRWNWDSSQLMTSITGSITGSDNIWLSECHISISPFADVMAFARNNYLAIYRINADINDATNYRELSLTYDTTLTTEPNEIITNLLCVPLVSQQKTSFGCADWTAIIIGFSSGYVRIYTESGGLLLSQLLHDEPIVNLKCQTFCSNNSGNDQTDELIIVYRTTVVVIDGFALYQTLRLCRNKLAKSHSLSTGFNIAFGNTNSDIHSLPLTYKKYSLQNCDTIVDCVNAGNHSRITYDSLVSQSMSGLSQSKSSSADLLITIGENPFIGFFRAHDGSSHTILNELTQAMINKVKNMIPLSLFGSNTEDNTQNRIESSTPIPLRLGFYDQREGIRLSLSPNKRLAAVLDDFGRVILIDVNKWIAIRMWKGYRDAEIGWIEVDEETPSTHLTKRAIFLIIYAPKRGILEIWNLELGTRVTAFNVKKTCRLFQCSYSMMGLNHQMFEQLKSLPDFSSSRCFLFDYNNGTIFNIDIPFLCALSDKNSKRMRDIHLLKELRNILKQYNSEMIEKIVTIVLMIKTADIRKQALDEITRISDIFLIKRVAEQLKEFLLKSIVKNELDYENKLIAQMCCRIISLCNFYEIIQSYHKEYDSYKTESSRPPDIQYLIDKLNWNGSDIAKILSFIAFRDSVVINQQSFSKPEIVNILEFISHFTLYSNHIVKDGSDEIYSTIPIELIMSDQKELQNIAYFIFIALFQTNEIDIQNYLKNSCIVPSNLLFLLFVSWLSSNCCEYWKCWEHFGYTLNFILTLTENETLNEENYLLSLNWKEILHVIYDSPNITGALIAVNMIKSVNSSVIKSDNKNSFNDSDMEWETLHVDNEYLNLVIKQFEDLFLLDMLLRSNKLKENDMITQNQISLNGLMRGGPGIVSELVAKWVIHSNISADVLNSLLESNNTTESNDKNEDNSFCIGEDALKYENMDTKTIAELLDHVRRCFPNCLESDVLFANCSWELLVQWNKEPSVIDNNLKNSLVYLNYVTSAVLKHNVACLLWKTYILKRFETLAMLMEKMGRMPKERICKKELGMGENCLESFLDYSCNLLDFILQTNMMAEIEPMPLFSIDDWWKCQTNSSNSNSSGVPLVMLAIHQKLANSALVLEHSRLSTIMFFIVLFQLKSSRPISLFTNAVQQYFFKDFHSFPVYTSFIEPSLSENRMKFLVNVITAIVQTLPADNQSERDQEFNVNKTKLFSQTNKFYGKILTLSREWELNTDEIRRKFVCELYSYGCDSLADEVMPSVVDITKLGLQMLTVAGIRLIYAINSKFGSLDEMHTLPPNTLFWLKSLDSNSNYYSECSLECTLAMLEHINNYIYDDKMYGRICETLIETVKHLAHN